MPPYPSAGSAAENSSRPISQQNGSTGIPNRLPNGIPKQVSPRPPVAPLGRDPTLLNVEIQVMNRHGAAVCQDTLGKYAHWNTGSPLPPPQRFTVTIPEDRMQTFESAKRYIIDQCVPLHDRVEWGLEVNEVWNAVQYTSMWIRLSLNNGEISRELIPDIETLRVFVRTTSDPLPQFIWPSLTLLRFHLLENNFLDIQSCLEIRFDLC